MNTTKPKKRIFTFDAIRAFAIVLVILCHICNEYPLVNTNFVAAIPSILHAFSHMGVPMFFMISGALLLNRDYGTISNFLKKRFNRIFYPFLFWMIILLVSYRLFYHTSTLELIYMAFGEGWLWFVWAIIAIYLAIPVLNPFIEKYQFKGIEYFFVIWAITTTLGVFGLHPFKGINFNFFTGYIGYVFLGYYITNKKFNLSDKKMFLIGTAIFLIFTALNLYVDTGLGYALYYLNPIIIIEAIGLYMMFRYVKSLENVSYESLKGKIVFEISKYSYGMYFSHVFVIGLVYKIFNLAQYSLIFLPVMLIVVTAISWFINFVISKIPVIKVFSGA